MHTLKNDVLEISIKTLGAELCSIKKGCDEYIWCGDAAFWARHSPVLFPIVGTVWNGHYRYNGVEYAMSQHGFARDCEFELIEQSVDCVRYRLMANENTKRLYPGNFCLEISYKLVGNRVEIWWEVTNLGDDNMYFQIGAHPAFNYPDYNPATNGRGWFSYNKKDYFDYILIKDKGCADVDNLHRLELEDGFHKLNTDTFEKDAFIVEDSQLTTVTLHKEDKTPWLSVHFDAPLVGLWSPPGKNAPFVCIEPWYGRCDRYGFVGEFKERDHVNQLAPSEKFTTHYTIEIH